MPPNDLGPIAQTVCIVVLLLSWVAVALRFYVRLRMVKSFGLDDWFITFTLMCFTAQVSLNSVGVHYGIGKHLADVHSISKIQEAMKIWLVLAILYTGTMTLLKISICLFLLRIASKPWHCWVLYGLMAVSIVFGIFFGFFLLFECKPISNFWTILRLGCLSTQIMVKVTLAHSGIMAAGDWTCAVLPIFLVWDIKMNKRMKVSVAMILSIGALGGVATIVRMVYLVRVSDSTEMLYETGNVVIWSLVEPGLGIIAVCLATLRPLFRFLFEKTVGLSHRITTSKGGSRSGGSRSRSQSRQLDQFDRHSKAWPLSDDSESQYPIKMTRLESRSVHSDSSGIAFGGVPKEFLVTTTVQGMPAEGKHDCVLVKVQRSFKNQEDERPILPVIYKTSEVTTERNYRSPV